ncbi:hypothetical protein [Virgibacillus senegalensis]|uniref:hypothetical protein n=1 Tax=Virgibacillus senegalensis TaxID=1499679 RepID=UPI00069E390F|nr:hypothetical protein [Virgibacillus senegalensis]
MSTGKAGRKKKLYPKDLIDNIIYEYAESNKVIGKIKYREVYQYAKKLYEEGKIKEKFSDDFWRKSGRQGRNAIDKANEVISKSVVASSGKKVDIMPVEDVVYKNYKDIEKLVKLLKPMELQLYDAIERENNLGEKIKKLELSIEEEKEKRRKAEEMVDNLQTLIFQMFEYSSSDEVPLTNLIRTGKTRHQLVENALNQAFNQPQSFFEMFEQHQESSKSDKVIDFNKENNKKSLADDYDVF